jgi:hypothetical protein
LLHSSKHYALIALHSLWRSSRAGGNTETVDKNRESELNMGNILHHADAQHAVKKATVVWCTMSTFIRGVARVPACGSRLEVLISK